MEVKHMSTGKIIGLVVIAFIGLWFVGYFLGWFGEAAKVTQEEFGPRAALKKYEWFINQANAIEKMDQDIALFENRIKQVDEEYSQYGNDKAKWPLHTQVMYNERKKTVQDDLVAVVSQKNNLVREYNAQSDKFNWKLFETDPRKPKEHFHEYVITH